VFPMSLRTFVSLRPRFRFFELVMGAVGIMSKITSLTNKRIEGRAPVWGFEFTTKAAILQGDSREFGATRVEAGHSITMLAEGRTLR
jgi:hypothetical protein